VDNFYIVSVGRRFVKPAALRANSLHASGLRRAQRDMRLPITH